MRRRRARHTGDRVQEKMLPTADAITVDTTDGFMNSDELALLGEPRGAHVMKGETPTDEPRGTHVMKGDPLLSVERRAVHAMKGQASPDLPHRADLIKGHPPSVEQSIERRAARAVKHAARTEERQGAHAIARRRWGLVPVAGAASALAMGLGGGGAFAYLISSAGHGLGTGETTTGSPVTIAVTAMTGKADLLPGRGGAAYFTLRNSASSGATFGQVAPGATVVSDNTSLCPSDFVSIAQTLPYTIPTAVTVSPGGTSGIQSIANLVKLSPNAPGTCQGVTFTVTFTLSGQTS